MSEPTGYLARGFTPVTEKLSETQRYSNILDEAFDLDQTIEHNEETNE